MSKKYIYPVLSQSGEVITNRPVTGLNKVYDFKSDSNIPVVVVYIVVNDYSYEKFGGNIISEGQSVLFLRRSFKVGAMKGQWSVVAGVDDFQPHESTVDGTIVSVVNEYIDETSLPVGLITKIQQFNSRSQENPNNPEQYFDQKVFCVHIHNPESGLTPPISIDWESMGAIWIPVEGLRSWVNDELAPDPCLEVDVVKKDGFTPDLITNTKSLIDFLDKSK